MSGQTAGFYPMARPWSVRYFRELPVVPPKTSASPTPMAHLILAIFLIVFGINVLFGLSIPIWVIGGLALVSGILFLLERFRVRVDRK